MFNKKFLLAVIISITVIAIPFLMILQGQTSKESSHKTTESKTLKQSIEKVKKNFPSVDYANESFTDADQKTKSEKYNKYKVLNSNVSEDTKEVSFIDWLTTTSPLPVVESNIVIIGKVVDAQAYLSGDKNSVYSEFKIELEKIFKNNSHRKPEGKNYIRAEREGGIVRFPSGYTT